MFYASLLISIAEPDPRYVGFTTDLKQRIKSHNKARRSTRRNTSLGSSSAISFRR
jgi:predicted GIY-YIG superfamily endonuclease